MFGVLSMAETDAKRPYTLSESALAQRGRARLAHGLYASGAEAARLRRRRLRARVRSLKSQFPALATAPDHLVVRYAEIDTLVGAVWVTLSEQGPVNEAGEPRRLVTEYRRLLIQLRDLAEVLGILNKADPLESLLGGQA